MLPDESLEQGETRRDGSNPLIVISLRTTKTTKGTSRVPEICTPGRGTIANGTIPKWNGTIANGTISNGTIANGTMPGTIPARRCDISGTLVVPLVVFVVLDSLLGVPIALFF